MINRIAKSIIEYRNDAQYISNTLYNLTPKQFFDLVNVLGKIEMERILKTIPRHPVNTVFSCIKLKYFTAKYV